MKQTATPVFRLTIQGLTLKKYVYVLPKLEPFLANVRNEKASCLFPRHPFATPEMQLIIKKMLNSGYTGELQKIYFDIKVSELLFLAFQVNPSKHRPNTNQTDVDKMHEAKNWLEQNIDHPATLNEIARLVGTNKLNLSTDFKKVFGTTVFDYLLKLRMQKAMLLLRETDKPVSEIAYQTGYSSHASFTNAFTNHFGYSPLFVRKKERSN